MDDNQPLALRKLPEEMLNPVSMEKKMKLVAVIVFKGGRRRSSGYRDENANPNAEEWKMGYLGHYTSFVKRGNSWVEYNDLTCAAKTQKPSSKVVPHQLVYVNV